MIQQMSKQVFVGLIIFVTGSIIVGWMRNRNIISPPVAKNDDRNGGGLFAIGV